MLKDITIGQYFPGNSIIHRMDSRFKIVLDILYVVILFVADNFISLAVAGLFILMAYAVSEIKPIMMLKSLKPLMPLILFTAILNLFFVKGEEPPLVDWWVFTIYLEGVTTTTSPIVLTDAIERLLSPLKKIKLPVHELAMIMTIALRFIPTLIEETDKIMSAQKARGADLDTGGLMKRAKALIPILIPLFVSAFKRANELAMAMECRCYRGGEGRTKLRQLKAAKMDYVITMLMLTVLGFVILNNVVF